MTKKQTSGRREEFRGPHGIQHLSGKINGLLSGPPHSLTGLVDKGTRKSDKKGWQVL